MDIVEKTPVALAELFTDTNSVAPPVAEDSGQEEEPPRQPGVMVLDPVRTGAQLDVLCSPDQVVDVAQVMDSMGFFLESISGVDWIDKQQLEVIYDYTRQDEQNCRVMTRTILSRTEPALPTISGVFPAADWHERETFDFYGVHFQNHPNLIRILLPEDADFHPLLKDFMP